MSSADIQKAIDTMRMLSVDMIQQANSGHPGLPLGAAPMLYTIWADHMKHNPSNPEWWDRDRFILSPGHGSSLLYSALHLFGYGLSMEELKKFRQWKSLTPGHPEYRNTKGVEATTGPLGQGAGMSVGMAAAEKALAERFNKTNFPVIDHYTYAIVSDGDLMEGVSSETASLAGTMKLGKLIHLYDDNHISIEGSTDLTFTEDVQKRYESYGWHTIRIKDGNNLKALSEAVKKAKAVKEKPSLILVRTDIGFGSPKEGTASAHGEPLGDAMKATKEYYKWPEKPFHVPEGIYEHFKMMQDSAEKAEQAWNDLFSKYIEKYPAEAAELEMRMRGSLPDCLNEEVPVFSPEEKPIATRSASGKILNAVAECIPSLIGGAADLGPSTKSLINNAGDFGIGGPGGRNFHFGIREHGMAAMANGMALHGGVLPYTATFFTFLDYMKPSVRLSAMMKIHTIYLFTHDSIGVGEDGPTHQPVEHLASLRVIPGMTTIRPADANETSAAWIMALKRKGPCALILTRQTLPVLDNEKYRIRSGVSKGGYVLEGKDDKPDLILIATGSEVSLALESFKILSEKGIRTRVVSMPSIEIFQEQDQDYQDRVLPPDTRKRIVIEAGSPHTWHPFATDEGKIIGLDNFGVSAPEKTVFKKFGFTTDNVVKTAEKILNNT